jgi:hypothetical protein
MASVYRGLHVAILCLLPLAGFSCTMLPGSEEYALYGSWRWVHSSGGFFGIESTPASTGSTARIEFEPGGDFRTFENDLLSGRGSFDLTDHDGELMIQYHARSGTLIHEQFVEFRDADTLVLMDNCADCFISTYERMK